MILSTANESTGLAVRAIPYNEARNSVYENVLANISDYGMIKP